MGLFQQRPEEEQNDWAGLPSEPKEQKDAAERLDDPPPVDPASLGFGGAVDSVVLPVVVPAEVPEDADGEPAEE